ncbi:exosome 3'-_5 exonuclease subunit ski4 (Csl4) [Ophidiomyces ophidiicola]|nr:exosome 3'->5 exonuclease subunit ski4 (Csl4) [Ophidiomyces ophidiicola]
MAAPGPSIAVPGQCLADSSSFTSGPGTYVRDSSICASIPGLVVLQELPYGQPGKKTKILTIARSPVSPTSSDSRDVSGFSLLGSTNTKIPPRFNTLPTVGSIVLGRVTRVQKRQASISVLVVLPDQNMAPDPTVIDSDLRAILANASISTTADPLNADELRPQALIRKEDVRAVEKDRVVLEESFRVGDIVRAVIVSVGDQVAYYASTAGNELGVVMARSSCTEAGASGFGGNMMFPVSWKEMRDPVTGKGETRKVAKPF